MWVYLYVLACCHIATWLVHINTHTCMHTYMHMDIVPPPHVQHASIYTHIHIRTHAHTNMRAVIPPLARDPDLNAAWGNHHFVCGGAVQGGRVQGKYPDSLREGSPLDVGRGRIIPEYSWEVGRLPWGIHGHWPNLKLHWWSCCCSWWWWCAFACGSYCLPQL